MYLIEQLYLLTVTFGNEICLLLKKIIPTHKIYLQRHITSNILRRYRILKSHLRIFFGKYVLIRTTFKILSVF